VGAPSSGGCDGVSGNDTTPAPSVELGAPRDAPPAAMKLPAGADDAPPTGMFVDPGEGRLVPTGTTIEPVVLAMDDFGVKSVSLTANGAPVAAMGEAPYLFSWTATDADIGSTVELAATITDSAGQTSVETVHVKVPVPDGYRAIAVDPTSADFGSIRAGFSDGRMITISNPGRNPLKLTALDLAGDGFFVYDAATTCSVGTMLAVGAECTVMPAFGAFKNGPATGSLTISYSAPGGGGPIVVPLTAVGNVPGPPVGAISAGTLKPSSTGALSVKLTCLGKVPCSGTLTVRTASPVGAKGRQRILKLAYVKFGPIPAGTAATVNVPLRPEALMLLRQLGKLKVKITASMSDESGKVSPLRSTKTLKVKTGAG
jgi:Bacterial Ig domain